jgi:hypothetical protein
MNARRTRAVPQPFNLGLLGFDQVGSLKPNAKH